VIESTDESDGDLPVLSDDWWRCGSCRLFLTGGETDLDLE
jgi:hypothetical protein